MKCVTHDGETYALVLSEDDFQPGARFVSEVDWPLQVGVMMLPSGHSIAAHTHLSQDVRSSRPTQEILILITGKMEVDFFDDAGQCFQTETLRQGNALLHICGGHAFRFLEPTRLFEVKSGPYLGRKKDKVLLEVDRLSHLPRPKGPIRRTST